MQKLRDIESQPLRHWNIDGIPELMMGVVWMLWGLLLIIGQEIPQRGAWKMYWMLVPLVLMTSGVWSQWMMNRLKRRFTWPRAGYMQPRDPSPVLRILTVFVAMWVAGGIAALVASGKGTSWEHVVAPAAGMVIAAALLVPATRMRSGAYLVLAGVATALSFWLYKSQLGWQGLNWLLLWLGLASTALGALRLSLFIRRNPPVDGDAA